MLVLTRKKGERVYIGADIVVTVIDVRGDGVRIGFDAPRGIPIQRAEVVAAVTAANEEALATAAGSADMLVSLIASTVRQGPPAEQTEAQTAALTSAAIVVPKPSGALPKPPAVQ